MTQAHDPILADVPDRAMLAVLPTDDVRSTSGRGFGGYSNEAHFERLGKAPGLEKHG